MADTTAADVEAAPMAHRKLVSMDAELYRRVEDYRWGKRINTESEALRRILAAGLDAQEKKGAAEEILRDLAMWADTADTAPGFLLEEFARRARAALEGGDRG